MINTPNSTFHVPAGALVLPVGPPGSGKSTAAAHWVEHCGLRPDAVVSLDALREQVSGDPARQDANEIVVDLAERIVAARLERRLTTVLDATNVVAANRANFAQIAALTNRPTVAIRFDVDEVTCNKRNLGRVRRVPEHAMNKMFARMRQAGTAKLLAAEGHFVVEDPYAVAFLPCGGHSAESDGRHLPGPFDFIGDVHGCFDTMMDLIGQLGYDETGVHPQGRMLCFVGDPNDRGRQSAKVLAWQADALTNGRVLAVASNHCDKMVRYLRRGDTHGTHGLAETISQIRRGGPVGDEFAARIVDVFGSLPSHLRLADGKVCVAHAGLAQRHQGRWAPNKGKDPHRAFALYGDTDGTKDPVTGFPNRHDWAADYRGYTEVVHGHVPVRAPLVKNKVFNIDTACCFGGSLTALRWPEHTFVSVPAHESDLDPALVGTASFADT